MRGLSVVTLFALVVCAIANRELCPHPEEAELEYAKESVSVDAIDANIVAVEMELNNFDITHEIISCVSIVPEEDGWGPVGCAVGENRRGGWSIKLLSADSEGIRTTINVYGPDLDDNNNPDEPENPDEPDEPIPDMFAHLLARSKHHMHIKKVHQY